MKTMLNLYIDMEIKSMAMAQGINLSKSFEEFLNILLSKDYKGEDKDKIIKSLKENLMVISGELTKKSEECEKLRIKANKQKIIPMPEWKK